MSPYLFSVLIWVNHKLINSFINDPKSIEYDSGLFEALLHYFLAVMT